MVNFKFNAFVKAKQTRFFLLIIMIVTVLFIIICLLLNTTKVKNTSHKKPIDVTGIVDTAFTEALEANALTSQQSELDDLKIILNKMQKKLEEMDSSHQKELQTFNQNVETKLLAYQLQQRDISKNPIQLAEASNHVVKVARDAQRMHAFENFQEPIKKTRKLKVVSFRKKTQKRANYYLNPKNYVPSNTSVRAVILGGADADASVNGQSKNNGVMLLKFIDEGTLPNGQRSKLSGCRASLSTYGDISSERAFGTLYRLSCARPGEPIIDKKVNGWVFYKGKVGIKGQPLMRDNKVMQWAGVSGALSGIAQAAQYAQSVQQFGTLGVSSVVPSSNIAPFAAYGGASKASDVLSQYYIKRAEQYHPVIQVGAGNEVTVVFKDGFYLEPEEEHIRYVENKTKKIRLAEQENAHQALAEDNFSVPPEILNRINNTYAQNTNTSGDYP